MVTPRRAPGQGASLPTATWRALNQVIESFGSSGAPTQIRAGDLRLEPAASQQVMQTLRSLGLVSEASPTLAMRRLLKDGTPIAAILHDRYPDLTAAIRSGAPAHEVQRFFDQLPAAPATKRRFRSLLLGALAADGVPVGAYRRQQPVAPRPEPPGAQPPTSLREDLIRSEAEAYLDALRRALEEGDDTRAEWVSARLRKLRGEH